MLFSDEESPLLKTWIVKRLEKTSDADADSEVLADYVIALLSHDGDIKDVRKLCEQEIHDFLSEDPKAFLDDLFQAIAFKSYLPGAPPAPKLGADLPPPSQPASFDPGPSTNSRKRGFDDRDDLDAAAGRRDMPHPSGRSSKQPRRGRGGRGDDRRGGRHGGRHLPMEGFVPNPNAPPFDPNNALEAAMHLQAVYSQFPGMPKWPPFANTRNQSRRKGRCKDFDEKGFCSRGSTCPYDHGNESIFVPPSLAKLNEEYDPSTSLFPNVHAQNPMLPFGFNPAMGRGGRGGRKHRTKKGGARAPFSADGPVHDRTKSTIVVENIPEESFSEEAVRGFFTDFGKIEEVSMQPYKHLAIVKFDKWGSANAAYQSPKAIFDNRFVKVFWYKDDSNGIPPSVSTGGEWSGDPQASVEEEPEIDMEEFQRRQDDAQKQHQQRETKRAELEQQRVELEQKQQELLARHREENEKLQAKLKGQGGETASSGTDLLRAKLAALENEAKMLGLDPDADEDAASSYSGSRGGFRGRGGRRGRGGFAPRGRGSYRGRGGNMHAAYAQYSIDNRPKKIAVTGVDFTAPEKDEVLRHFLINLGQFESVDPSPSVTHVSFQDRKSAEKFYYSLHGKELPGIDGRLELAWVSAPLPPVKPTFAPHNGGSTAATGDDKGDAMAGLHEDEAPEEGELVSHQEDRTVNMDYEVADEDGW